MENGLDKKRPEEVYESFERFAVDIKLTEPEALSLAMTIISSCLTKNKDNPDALQAILSATDIARLGKLPNE